MSAQQPLEPLSNSVSSTPSSSVQPPELAHHQQQEYGMPHAGQGNMMPPTDVSMDGAENYQNPGDGGNSPINKDGGSASKGDGKSKSKSDRLRLPRSRACVACHTGKTRCSDSLPCQSCIKRGIANTCSYPDPMDNATDAAPRAKRQSHPNPNNATNPGANPNPMNPPMGVGGGTAVFSASPQVRGFYYDNGSGSGTGTFAPATGAGGGANGATTSVMTPQAAAAAVMASAGMRRDDSPGGRPSKKAKYRNLSEQELASFTPKQYKRGTFFVGDSAPVSIDPRLPLRLLLADEERVDFFVGDGLPP